MNSKYRPGLSPLLTQEENEEYAISAISRHKTRTKFEAKIGRLRYAFGRYEELCRATIPINLRHYLLITLDREESNFDSIITGKILPLIADHATKFELFKKNAESEYESGTFRCSVCAKEFLTKDDADSHSQEHKKEAVHAGE